MHKFVLTASIITGIILVLVTESPIAGFLLAILSAYFYSFLWGYIKGKALQGNSASQELLQLRFDKSHNIMEEFHVLLSDTIISETGKKMPDLDEFILVGIISVEIELSMFIAEDNGINGRMKNHFAASVLERANIPKDYAAGMIRRFNSEDESIRAFKESCKVEEIYKRLGTDKLEEQIKWLIRKLINDNKLLNQIKGA